ncbi:MAG TPA: tetratricopeptide repeat protein [Fibrobacteria bacterium]|nr:tetratricopeptide repeat protein [Fibrobacteria bacterium]
MLALLGAWAYAAAGGCHYLELRAPGETKAGESRELPLYLAYPDTLGPVAVRPFLEASSSAAQGMLKESTWQLKTLTAQERGLLKALRNLVDGHVQEAGEEIAALTRQAPPRLRSGLRVDRALLVYLAGFPADAEKEWRGVLKAGSDCEEVAWRNLYSLYLGRKDFAQAHGLVDEVLRGDPKNKWANAAKGYLLRMLMSDEDWAVFLRDKSSWQDSLFEIQIAYGKFLKEQGQWEEARKYYSRGLEGAPRNGQAWLELGDIQYHLGYFVFAETCLRNAFSAGINDPYVFELYGRVLTGLSTYAATGWEMRELGFSWDAAWAARCWRLAERILEDGFPHDLHSRSMAQLLYHLYCHNGRVEAAQNLRSGFWFHFRGPAVPKRVPLGEGPSASFPRLAIPVSFITYPLIVAAGATDFFEPF